LLVQPTMWRIAFPLERDAVHLQSGGLVVPGRHDHFVLPLEDFELGVSLLLFGRSITCIDLLNAKRETNITLSKLLLLELCVCICGSGVGCVDLLFEVPDNTTLLFDMLWGLHVNLRWEGWEDEIPREP